MKVKELTTYLEAWAHLSLQEDYDNSGLLVGHDDTISGILVSLDCTEDIIMEAISRGCNVVVSHHPILFKPVKRFTGTHYTERTVMLAIQHRVAIYAIHTNLDNVHTGVNKKICDLIGLHHSQILAPKLGTLGKLFTYVPLSHVETVKNALFTAGAGSIGNYDECSFETSGKGTFRANDQATPYLGKSGVRHTEAEQKIEVIFPLHLKDTVLQALKSHHPYEEVAYEIIKLENEHPLTGSGMIGELAREEPIHQVLTRVKEIFKCGVIKYTHPVNESVKRIAVCGGSGFFLLKSAIKAGAQLYITSDIKYHEFFEADGKITLADIGHFESEQFTIELLVAELLKKFTTFAVLKANTNTNPVKYL